MRAFACGEVAGAHEAVSESERQASRLQQATSSKTCKKMKLGKKKPNKQPAAAGQEPTAPVPKPEDLEAAKLEEAKRQEETILHQVRKVTAQKPPRSYVTACYCDGSKHRQKLICEFAATKFPDHVQKALEAVKQIEELKCTFKSARALKLAATS